MLRDGIPELLTDIIDKGVEEGDDVWTMWYKHLYSVLCVGVCLIMFGCLPPHLK